MIKSLIDSFVTGAQQLGLNVSSIIVTKDGDSQSRSFRQDLPCNIRSISKVVTCLGVYTAIKSGVFDLDSFVLPFFKRATIRNPININPLQQLKIKHLLTLTAGHERGLMFSKDMKALSTETDWIDYVLNEDMPHLPGEYFVYNNAASYLLSAIIQQETGRNLAEWTSDTILKDLGIQSIRWETTSQNICLGASGLWLNNADMHKVALLLLRNGETEKGKQIVETQWISEMSSPKVMTANLSEYASKQERSLNKLAYGYHLWICGDKASEGRHNYFCDGTDGQFMIILPNKNMAITVLSEQKNMHPFYPLFDAFVR